MTDFELVQMLLHKFDRIGADLFDSQPSKVALPLEFGMHAGATDSRFRRLDLTKQSRSLVHTGEEIAIGRRCVDRGQLGCSGTVEVDHRRISCAWFLFESPELGGGRNLVHKEPEFGTSEFDVGLLGNLVHRYRVGMIPNQVSLLSQLVARPLLQ